MRPGEQFSREDWKQAKEGADAGKAVVLRNPEVSRASVIENGSLLLKGYEVEWEILQLKQNCI